MMELLRPIMDYPAIIQAVIGAALFWLIYELAKWVTNLGLKLVAQFSIRVRRELKAHEALYYARSLSVKKGVILSNIMGISIVICLNRGLHGFVYLCIGAISAPFLGNLSVIAYIIALTYFLIGLRAVRASFSNENLSKEERTRRFHRAYEELLELRDDSEKAFDMESNNDK